MESNNVKVPTPESVVEVRDFQHYNELLEKYSRRLIIVNFWSPSCPHCLNFMPIFMAAQQYYKKNIVFLKVNIMSPAGYIAQRVGVEGVPTILFGVGNNLIYKQIGAPNGPQFKDLIERVIAYLKKQQDEQVAE
jgi:thioredoxin-like negative regulator of GroEL